MRPDDHPTTAYIREDALLRTVDRWLVRVFDPDHLDDTIDSLAAADRNTHEERDDSLRSGRDDATKTLAECDKELVAYRAALKEGADPAVVTRWIAETQAKRLAAQRTLRLPSANTATPAMTREDLLQLIDKLGDVIAAVGTAEPAEKAAVYSELGVTIIYDPATHTAVAECSLANEPCGKRSCRRGDPRLLIPPSSGVFSHGRARRSMHVAPAWYPATYSAPRPTTPRMGDQAVPAGREIAVLPQRGPACSGSSVATMLPLNPALVIGPGALVCVADA